MIVLNILYCSHIAKFIYITNMPDTCTANTVYGYNEVNLKHIPVIAKF